MQFNNLLIISPDIYHKCDKFAKESISTNLFVLARRGQTQKFAIERQIRSGKIAEELVYNTLIVKYPNLSPPDFTIYSNKNKSWDPDLKDNSQQLTIAVKSQEKEQALQYYESWVFQFNNGKNFDCDTKIFTKNVDPNYYVAFVLLNTPKKMGQIKAIVKVNWLHENKLFQPMTLQKFSENNNKLAVYYDHPDYISLSHFPNELWQL